MRSLRPLFCFAFFARPLFVAALLAGVTITNTTSADQRRDFMARQGQKTNTTYAVVDLFLPGIQANIEHRRSIYGSANELILRGGGIASYPFGQIKLDVDIRLVVLFLGVSVGVNDTWRNLQSEPGQQIHRKERRELDFSGDFNTATFGFAEARAQLALPMNEYVIFNSVNSVRYEARPDRSFDWFLGVVHDGGNYVRSDNMLLFKHRDWGGLGPLLQILDFPLDNERHTIVNWGAMFVARPGIRRRDDIFLFQILFHTGPFKDSFGVHTYRGPFNLLIAYRSLIEL